jgi:hypothetical protein
MSTTNNGNRAPGAATPGGTVRDQNPKSQATPEDDDSYLDQYAGMGTDDLSGGTPYLSICQKVTEEGMVQGKKLGEWWHSGLNITLGKNVRVVPMGWKRVWVEKKDGRTIRYHKPDSIPVLERGSGKDYTCINPATKNKIEKTTMVPMILPDHEESLCLMIPTVKSAEAMKSWRKALDFNRLSSGAKAPIFSHVWELSIDKMKDGSYEYYVIGVTKKGQRVPNQFLIEGITPLLDFVAEPMRLLPAQPTVAHMRDVGDDTNSHYADDYEAGTSAY